MIIAIPSKNPGGLNAEVSNHFGHCEAYTLVTLADNTTQDITILPNGGHAQGGCMAPVMQLKNAGVNALIAGGMGMRPLAGFQQVGIDVYYSEKVTTVEEALQLVTSGVARKFGPAQVCGGGGDCGSH